VRQLRLLVGQRPSYVVDEPHLAGTELLKVSSCFSKTEFVVWPTSRFVGVMVVLAVILPEANLAYLISASLVQGFESTARAQI